MGSFGGRCRPGRRPFPVRIERPQVFPTRKAAAGRQTILCPARRLGRTNGRNFSPIPLPRKNRMPMHGPTCGSIPPGSAGTTDPAVLSARSAASGVPAEREASAQPALSAGDAVQESGRGAGIAAPSSGERNVSGAVGGRRDVPVGEPARMSAGRTYLVLGVYSTADNARRAARETVAKNPEIVPHIYFFGDKFMVSIGTYDSRDEATERSGLTAAVSAACGPIPKRCVWRLISPVDRPVLPAAHRPARVAAGFPLRRVRRG